MIRQSAILPSDSLCDAPIHEEHRTAAESDYQITLAPQFFAIR